MRDVLLDEVRFDALARLLLFALPVFQAVHLRPQPNELRDWCAIALIFKLPQHLLVCCIVVLAVFGIA